MQIPLSTAEQHLFDTSFPIEGDRVKLPTDQPSVINVNYNQIIFEEHWLAASTLDLKGSETALIQL